MQPDEDFGPGGKRLLDFAGGPDYAYAVSALPDGKVLIAGKVTGEAGSDVALMRLNADGSLDTSFGVGGRVITDLGSTSDAALAMLVQPDGKIVLVGTANGSLLTSHDFAVIRYNADGSLDAGFGAGGWVRTDFANGFDQAYAVALQPDGKLVVAGTATVGSARFAVARYNADGTPDATFGQAGKATAAIPQRQVEAYALAIKSTGEIVLAGSAEDPNGQRDFALAVFLPNGSLDRSFGGGIALNHFGYGDESWNALAIEDNGAILVGGVANGDAIMMRFLGANYIDSGFGQWGILSMDFGGGEDGISAISLGADGRITIVGYASRDGESDLFAMRVDTTGAPDETFAPGGRLFADFGSPDERALAVSIWQNRLVVAGYSAQAETDADMAVVQFISPLPPPEDPPPPAPDPEDPPPPPPPNSAPAAQLSGPALGVPWQTLVFAAAWSDADAHDTHEAMWDFSDGTVLAYAPVLDATLAQSHMYAAPGVYTVTVRVRDAAGDVASASVQINVSAVALIADPVDPSKLNLVVGGTGGNDVIQVRKVCEKKQKGIGVWLNGQLAGVFNPTGRIMIYGGDGDDVIKVGACLKLAAEIDGGAGNDLIKGGGGHDTLIGGDGKDRLNGRGGQDLIRADKDDWYPGRKKIENKCVKKR